MIPGWESYLPESILTVRLLICHTKYRSKVSKLFIKARSISSFPSISRPSPLISIYNVPLKTLKEAGMSFSGRHLHEECLVGPGF